MSLGTDMLEMVNIYPLQNKPVSYITTGNLHLNVIADAYTPEIQAALEPYIYEVVGECLLPSHRTTPYLFIL